MACILLTGGRAPVCLDLARLLAQRGHRVLVAESQTAQLCRTSRAVSKTFAVPPPRQRPQEFVRQLVEIVNAENVDVVIPTCEEVFYISRGRDQFPPHCYVWVDDFDKIKGLHDKWIFNQSASKCGLTTPLSFLVSSREALVLLAAQHEKTSLWILKPAFSRFGNNIHQGNLETLLKAPVDFADGKVWVLQEFVKGPEYCAYAVAEKGVLRACSIYAHAFVAGRAGICFEEIDCTIIEHDLREFLLNIEFTGQIAFDFILKDGRAYALECNPRATSGIHLLSSTIEFADVFVNGVNGVTAADVSVGKKDIRGLRPHLGHQSMLVLAMCTFAIPQIRSFRILRHWASILFSSREVLFSWRDPLPFFDQLLCMGQLWWQSCHLGLDILSTSTADIEWNGEL